MLTLDRSRARAFASGSSVALAADNLVTVPVRAAAEGPAGLLGLVGDDGGGCALLSRCTVSVGALQPRGNVAKGATPPAVKLVLAGLVGGFWVPLVAATWAPDGWSAPALIWWDGGLVEGFALFARVPRETSQVELSCTVRLLADRSAGRSAPVVGPLVTVDA